MSSALTRLGAGFDGAPFKLGFARDIDAIAVQTAQPKIRERCRVALLKARPELQEAGRPLSRVAAGMNSS